MSNADHSSRGPISAEFSAQVSDETFNWRPVQFQDAKVTGAQIAEAAGAHPVGNFVVLQQLKTFELESLRPTELANLDAGTRFFVIKGDGTKKFSVDGLSLEWPRKSLSGSDIKQLVGKDHEEVELILERDDGSNKIIDDDENINLQNERFERFITRPFQHEFKIIINAIEHKWNKRWISFHDLISIEFPTAPASQNVTITFFGGPPSGAEGVLGEGDSIKIKDRMVFGVKFTDKS